MSLFLKYANKLFKLKYNSPCLKFNKEFIIQLTTSSNYFSITQPFIPPSGLSSYVALGTTYENQVIQKLHQLNLGIQLYRTGGAGDGGIDFRGIWNLPNKEQSIDIIGQCKRTSKVLAPKYLREFEGVMARCKNPTLGLIVCSKGFGKSTVRHMMGAKVPIMFLTLEEVEEVEKVEKEMNILILKHCLLNLKANQLLSYKVTSTQIYGGNKKQNLSSKGDFVTLFYDGKPF